MAELPAVIHKVAALLRDGRVEEARRLLIDAYDPADPQHGPVERAIRSTLGLNSRLRLRLLEKILHDLEAGGLVDQRDVRALRWLLDSDEPILQSYLRKLNLSPSAPTDPLTTRLQSQRRLADLIEELLGGSQSTAAFRVDYAGDRSSEGWGESRSLSVSQAIRKTLADERQALKGWKRDEKGLAKISPQFEEAFRHVAAGSEQSSFEDLPGLLNQALGVRAAARPAVPAHDVDADIALSDADFESPGPAPAVDEEGPVASDERAARGQPAERTLRRSPHLDLSKAEPLEPGSELEVYVYADRQEARRGEQAEDILVDLPPGSRAIDLKTYLLVSPHFEITGPAIQNLNIDADREATDPIAFAVRVRSEEEILSRVRDLPSVSLGSISAVFSYRGQPSGSVSRILNLRLSVTIPDMPGVRARLGHDTIRLNPDDQAPDLLVQVRAHEINDGRQFRCRVSTGLIEAEEEDDWYNWNLPLAAEEVVQTYMAGFEDEQATPLARLATLRGAGLRFFDAAPANFRSVFWKLVDAGRRPRHIAIVSDEPLIPWELMIPHRRTEDGRLDSRAPIGVECAVGRWVANTATSAPERFPLSTSIVIAPQYKGRHRLRHAESEARLVLDQFPGLRVKPALLESIDDALKSEKASVLHFACHGADDGPRDQSIYLEDGQRLSSTMLMGLDGFLGVFVDATTLVLLNACQVGRPTPALVGIGGFAKAFIDLGASGVIAPLWSVQDSTAHEVARAFYEAVVQEPARPFADILSEIRGRTYDPDAEPDDTYAAYCFYGNPLARRVEIPA